MFPRLSPFKRGGVEYLIVINLYFGKDKIKLYSLPYLFKISKQETGITILMFCKKRKRINALKLPQLDVGVYEYDYTSTAEQN
jgi:hypothetical protein